MAAVYNIERKNNIRIGYTNAINYLIDNISNYESGRAHLITLTAEGPIYGCSLIKANDNIFAGIIFGYYKDAPVYFNYNNGVLDVYKLYID